MITFFKKLFLPPGPILSLTLIGLMTLSAQLYYKAVKVQRFLEPALAMSQPEIEFSQKISSLVEKEFGTNNNKGILVSSDSIFIDRSLILGKPVHGMMTGHEALGKLGKVFLSLVQDQLLNKNLDIILVIIRQPVSRQSELNLKHRLQIQYESAFVLDSLYKANPVLEEKYGSLFTSTALLVPGNGNIFNWIEFRIISRKSLHAGVIKDLFKYLP